MYSIVIKNQPNREPQAPYGSLGRGALLHIRIDKLVLRLQSTIPCMACVVGGMEVLHKIAGKQACRQLIVAVEVGDGEGKVRCTEER